MEQTTTGQADADGVIGFEDVLSDDGTRIRAWTNDPDGVKPGPTVVLCNGLGTNAWAWPALVAADCDVRVVSWNHRGVSGSARPTDARRVAIGDFVDDALSVMDHFGVDRATLMGWSMGVNTMFELAVRHPERVSGLFAVCGVPGDTFATMLGPLHVPRWAARLALVNTARAVKIAGRALTPVTTRIPMGRRFTSVVSHSGFMLPVAEPELAARAIREFFSTPVEWYSHLALATSKHARVSLSGIEVPAVFVAGAYDLLAGTRHLEAAASKMTDAAFVELRTTHFAQMEQPEVVHQLLLEFLERVEVSEQAS